MAIDDNTSYELTGYQVKDLAQKIRAKADASSLASVATSGLYSDLIGTPTIPTVYNGKLTIKQNGATIDEFTANQSSDTTISLTDTTYSDFTGATSSVAGVAGLVPAPAAGDDTKFLSGNGLWTTVSQYSLPIASSSTLGGIKVGNNLTIDPLTGVLDADGSTYTAGNGIDITNDEISIDTSVVAELSDIPTVNDSTITIQKNGTTVDSFTTNAAANKTINITVPTTAADVSALPASTKYGATFELSINSTTYVVTATLKDQDGNTLGTAQTIDLPLESVVVNGSYDSQTKEVVLTLQSGSTIRFSVADLVSGLQTEITSSNKLSADLVDDSTTTNKFVTASDKTAWNGKQNALTAGSNIQINGTTISATDTTYSNMTGATSGTAGVAGLVPAPAAGDQDKVLSGAGTWVAQSGGGSYTAGNHIDITNNVISAEGYIWGDDAAPASTPASTITSAMIVDGTIQATDIATGVVPIITMVDTDPGEGSPLAANNFIAVYGDDPSNMNYSLTEAKTGATWIDGSPIYKKTINFGALPNATDKTIAHNISNLSLVIKAEGFFYNPNGNVFSPFPQNFSGNSNMYSGCASTMVITATDVRIGCTTNMSTNTAYITLYYTKSS